MNTLELSTSDTERFWSKVKKVDSGCWEWIAGKDKDGYGQFKLNKIMQKPHRISYNENKGKIPKGLELDHLCRNRKCVNPEHLEAVTHTENMKRSHPNNLRKTHCPKGHEYNKENTYVYPSLSGFRRHCKACVKNTQRLRRQK